MRALREAVQQTERAVRHAQKHAHRGAPEPYSARCEEREPSGIMRTVPSPVRCASSRRDAAEQEEKIMTDEKNIDELTELLIELEKLEVCFARNVFRYRIEHESGSILKRFFARTSFNLEQSEIKFLFLFFDCFDNIPDLLKFFLKFRTNNEIDINDILLKSVSSSLSFLHELITEKSIRKECGITDTHEIKAWIFGLHRMTRIIPRICELLGEPTHDGRN